MSRSSSMMPAPTTFVRPLWQYTTTIYLAMTVVFYLLTTQLVKPVRRWRIGWRGLIALLIVLALLAAGSLIIFGTDWGSTGWRGSPAPTEAPFPMMIEREVFVERVIEIPVPPAISPLPTATPAPPPTPVPFDASEHEAAFEAYLPQELLPGGEGFCDLDILWTNAEFEYGEIVGWVYCRNFSLADDELVPGIGTSTIARLGMYWMPNQDWQIGGGTFGNMQAMIPPEVLQQLLETPYNEAAGEERLRERARQELLGE